MTSATPFLYPNVGSVPSRTEVDANRKPAKGTEPVSGEFDQAFDKALGQSVDAKSVDLNTVRTPLKFSAHAMQRLNDRKINLDPATMQRINTAVDKAASKGVQDTLVLTKDAALIVSVKNRTVVTAMDRNAMDGNVFTNIDGAVFA